MKKITISVGLANRVGQPIKSEVPVRQLKARLTRLFGGITVQPTIGGWVNEEGDLLEEQSLQITIYTEEAQRAAVVDVLQQFTKATDQESAMLVVEESSAVLAFI